MDFSKCFVFLKVLLVLPYFVLFVFLVFFLLLFLCVLFTDDIGGVLTLVFDEEGNLLLEVSANEGDLLYDDIGSELKIRQIRKEKAELLQSLELYYKVFFLGEDVEE